MFIDEFLGLFKGQISLSELKQLTYKESVFLRNTRIKRLEKEQPDMGDLADELDK